jgi:Asp-tRNA(Asn)/Glu-tRNA(Gln) amidotransferase A subunit family amidase
MSGQLLSGSLQQAFQALRSGQLTSDQLCRLSLERVSRTRTLNAFITVPDLLAKHDAQQADNRAAAGNHLVPHLRLKFRPQLTFQLVFFSYQDKRTL